MGKYLILCLLALVCTGCTTVGPGDVGIKVNYWGEQKGVDDVPIVTGRVLYNPITTTVYTYPTYMQNRRWLIKDKEGFTFTSSEGAKIEASVALNYSLKREKVPVLFVAHRASLDIVTDTYVKSYIQDALTKLAPKYSNIEIMGPKQEELLGRVKQRLIDELADRGFMFDNVSFIGAPEPDEKVVASINAVIQANQHAQEAQAKVAQVKAEADQARELAQGAADAIGIRSRAEAEANLTVAKSITSTLIQYELTKKWDGVAPRVFSGDKAGMMLNVGADGK